jgi:3-hydroxy-9,10-secoandrosta-1,3,5(10)-triene-9,17-dione monooxygenase reductase component
MTDGGIHYEDPFATPADERSPVRRLRGRLAAGVTIWTSGGAQERAGLTVSSTIVVDGDPPEVAGVISDTTAVWEAIHDTGAFVIHVLHERHRTLADVFAGLRPSPGGPFASIEVHDSEFGPVLPFLSTRIACRLLDSRPTGYSHLVRAEGVEFELGDLGDPLVLFRGGYRRLAPGDE